MDIYFNDIKELYNRVYPALKSKVKELKKNDITYIKENDIWNCLVEKKWKHTKGLLLFDIVDDILNVDNTVIENFVKEKIKSVHTPINLDDTII